MPIHPQTLALSYIAALAIASASCHSPTAPARLVALRLTPSPPIALAPGGATTVRVSGMDDHGYYVVLTARPTFNIADTSVASAGVSRAMSMCDSPGECPTEFVVYGKNIGNASLRVTVAGITAIVPVTVTP
jgi:hypothetical protein